MAEASGGAPRGGRLARTDADADAGADAVGGAAAMKVLVLYEGARHQVQIAGTQSAGELCAKLEPLIGIAAESMTLTLGREPLCHELPLAEQGVQDRDRLTCSRHAAATSASAVLESAMQEVEACSAALDELGAKVAAAQPPHQEHFTRILEQLDAICLDGLDEEERDVIRPMRKAQVPTPPSATSIRTTALLKFGRDWRVATGVGSAPQVRRCDELSGEAQLLHERLIAQLN